MEAASAKWVMCPRSPPALPFSSFQPISSQSSCRRQVCLRSKRSKRSMSMFVPVERCKGLDLGTGPMGVRREVEAADMGTTHVKPVVNGFTHLQWHRPQSSKYKYRQPQNQFPFLISLPPFPNLNHWSCTTQTAHPIDTYKQTPTSYSRVSKHDDCESRKPFY